MMFTAALICLVLMAVCFMGSVWLLDKEMEAFSLLSILAAFVFSAAGVIFIIFGIIDYAVLQWSQIS